MARERPAVTVPPSTRGPVPRPVPDPVAPRPIRVFAAVWPPDQLVTRLRDLPREHRPGLRWTTEAQWHVTVHFLGAVEAGDLPAVRRELAAAAAVSAPADVVAGPRIVRLGSAVLVLPVEGLDRLAAAVRRNLEPADTGEARPFRGHLTLARGRRPSTLAGLGFDRPTRDPPNLGGRRSDRPRSDDLPDGRSGSGRSGSGRSGSGRSGSGGPELPELSCAWTVREMTLVRSHLRPDGAVYEVLDRWSLDGSPERPPI